MKFSGLVVACLASLASFTLAEEEERVWIQYEEGQRSACLDTMTSFTARSMPPVKIHREFSNVGAFVVTATKDEIKELTLNKAVKMIAKDNKYHAMHIPESIQQRELQSDGDTVPYGIDMVQATAAHEKGFMGKGAKVCVLDTGIDSVHEDFIGSNLSGDDADRLDWKVDDIGHGTHCSGTIGAAKNGLGVVGVAPEAEIFTIRVFNEAGMYAYGSSILSAIEKCAENGFNIVSMSLGGPLPNIFEYLAYSKIAEEEDMILVAAAGNGGNGWWSYPASYPGVISVAAIDEDMELASFSQTNRHVDLSAPGVDVLSTFPTTECAICDSLGVVQYGIISGTSMATPHVAGVAALLRGAYPDVKAADIAKAMTGSAMKLGSGNRDRNNKYGYGLVQAVDALEYLSSGGGEGDGEDGDGDDEDPWWCFWCSD